VSSGHHLSVQAIPKRRKGVHRETHIVGFLSPVSLVAAIDG
jgi:hypothetical protein